MPVSEPFRRQVALLVPAIPFVAAETCFALKGGTVINLFAMLATGFRHWDGPGQRL